MHTSAFTAEGAKLDSGGIRNQWNSKLLLQGGCCNLIGFGLSIQPKVLDATRNEEVVNANMLWAFTACAILRVVRSSILQSATKLPSRHL